MTSFCFPVDLLRKRTLHYLLFAMNEHIFVVDNQFKFAEGAISKNMKSSVKLTTLQANNSIDVLLTAKTTYLRWRNINYSHQFIYAKCVQLYTNLVFLLYSFFYMRNGTGSKYECFQEKAATQFVSLKLLQMLWIHYLKDCWKNLQEEIIFGNLVDLLLSIHVWIIFNVFTNLWESFFRQLLLAASLKVH